jgi:serine/threonine-protein kinase
MSEGRFEYLEVLGEGTSGTVYRARDEAGREVAVKLFRANVARDPAQLKRFRREVEIARELRHENLVATFHGGQALGGRLYIATELVRGGDLHQVLTRAGPFPEAAALVVLRDVLTGLDTLDQKGLVHRDVKPGNVLLSEEGRALLSDFGLAKPAGPLAAAAAAAADERDLARGEGPPSAATLFARITATGEVVGTPYYLAPEQILGARDVDVRADIYAAGVVLFELLTGRPPFDGASVVEIAEAHLSSPVPDLPAMIPGLSPGTAALACALLEKHRELRPPTPGHAAARAEALVPDMALAREALRAHLALSRERDVGATVMLPARATARSGTLSSGPAGHARARPLTARWRLDLLTERGTLRLFAIAGEVLEAGRDAVDRSENDVCLRVRGGGEGADTASKKISSRHFRIEAVESRAVIVDLGSKGGTRLDGVKLVPQAPVPLKPLTTVSVAGVLELEAHTLRSPQGAVEAVLLQRPQNGPEHAYALVRERIRLGVRGGLPAVGLPAGTGADLAVRQGRFFLDGHPIDAGDLFETVGGMGVEVGEILPDDMK